MASVTIPAAGAAVLPPTPLGMLPAALAVPAIRPTAGATAPPPPARVEPVAPTAGQAPAAGLGSVNSTVQLEPATGEMGEG